MTALRAELSEADMQWIGKMVKEVMRGDVSTHIASFNLDLLFSDPKCEYTAFLEAVLAVKNAADGVIIRCMRIQEKL